MWRPPCKIHPLRDVALILSLGLVPTVVSHSILNHAVRVMNAQVVGIADLRQVLFAGILAALPLQESSSLALYPASPLVTAGIVVAFADLLRPAASDPAPAAMPAAGQSPPPQ